MAHIWDLLKKPGGRSFYQELQLVLSIYRLEEVELTPDASLLPERVEDTAEPSQLLIRYHGVFLLYRLLLAINEKTLVQFLVEVRRLDPQLSAFCQLCKGLEHTVGGKQFWQWVNTVVFNAVPSFSFWNFKTQCTESLYRDEAVDALHAALRVSPFDPIFNIASFIRNGGLDSIAEAPTYDFGEVFDELFGGKQKNFYQAQYGSKLALPMEQVERLSVMNYTLPLDPLRAMGTPAPYPR